MDRRNFQPASQQFNERQITREYKRFTGMYEDTPTPPDGGVKLLENYIAFGDRLEVRPGTRKWSSVKRPAFRTPCTFSKATTPDVNGQYKVIWTNYEMIKDGMDSFLGMSVKWPNGDLEEIVTDVITPGGVASFTVAESKAQADTTAAEIWAPFCGWCYHQGRKRIVWQFGNEIYVSDEAMTFLNRAYSRTGEYGTLTLTATMATPAVERSQFAVVDDSVYIFNKNGIFCLNLNRYGNESPDLIGAQYASGATNFYTYFQLNTVNPVNKITAVPRTTTKKYGYRYFYTLTELTNPGDLSATTYDKWNRTITGVRVICETPPCDASASGDLNDYSEIWLTKPVGDATILYAEWIRTSALPSGFDTIAELVDIIDGQFKITVDSITKNIKVNWAGVSTWDEAAEKLTDALQSGFVDVYAIYDRPNATFKIINPLPGGRITAIAAGDGGTDISSMFTGPAGADGKETTPAKYENASCANLLLSRQGVGNADPYNDHFTHFSLYRTLDIGVNGIDNVTVQGNNKELFIWVGDYPITRQASASCVLEAASGVALNGRPYNATLTPESATLPTAIIGLTVTNPEGTYFGRVHGLSGNVAYVQMNKVTAGTYVMGWNTPSLSVTQTITDTVSDDTLRTRISNFSCLNRLWKALPRYRTAKENKYDLKYSFVNTENTACGCIGLGFILSSYVNENLIYYGQIPDGYVHLAGYGNQARQVIRLEDSIQKMLFLVDSAVVFCRHSIWQIQLNNYSDTTYEDLGLNTSVLSSQREISRNIGCIDTGSVIQTSASSLIFKASDGSMRVIEYNGGGFVLSDSLSKNIIEERLNKLTGLSASVFDSKNGYMLFSRETVGELDKCFRMAVKESNGFGWSIYSGDAWIRPEQGGESITVFDSYGRHSTLVLDKDGYVYDISGLLSGATGITKIRKDKTDITGTGGTDIVTKVKLPEEQGTFEHMFIEHMESHLYVRAADETKRNTTGYDTAGFPDDTEFDMTLFADGEQATYSAEAKNIKRTGDITFDRKVVAHRLQLELECNNGEHIVVGVQQYNKAADSPAEPDNRVNTEDDHQAIISDAVARLGWNAGSLLNLVDGAGASAVAMTEATDPAGTTKAIATAGSAASIMSGNLSGDFSIIVSVKDIEDTDLTKSLIECDTLDITITESSGIYSLNYTDGTTTQAFALTWDGTGWCYLCVTRADSTLTVYEAYQ